MNSLEAISARKCWPPFLTQVSVSFTASQYRRASQALQPSGSGQSECMGAPTYVQGAQLGIWILVADAFLERAHGFLWRDGLGSDDIGYLEVQSYVLPVEHRIASHQQAATGNACEPGNQIHVHTSCYLWPC